jgi:ABC-type Fe3+-siderophore transport system permease subunit
MTAAAVARRGGLVAALGTALIAVAVVSAGLGAFDIPTTQVVGSLLHRVGIGLGPLPDHVGEEVLWNVRFPRIVLGVLVGASLGCAGALMQGIFGNPLAEPGIIGISSGAAVGAVVAIVTGLVGFGHWGVALPAFAAGVVALLTAAAVSVAGAIGFVGLLVPHLIRMITGPGHRLLLPASTLGGAVVLTAADLFCRTVVAPAEIPLGSVTALLGGPFFFWLLVRTRAQQGGWA